MRPRKLVFAAALTAALTVTVGCGSNSDSAASDATSSSGTTAAPRTTEPVAREVLRTASFNGRNVLTDTTGRMLYLFTKDTPGSSACAKDCLVKWPPLMSPVTATGPVDSGRIGTLVRPEGGAQVTYAGKPLYYFAGDKTPGETNGQGVLNAWYLVGTDGEAVR